MKPYPGQDYFRRTNPNIKRAEEEWEAQHMQDNYDSGLGKVAQRFLYFVIGLYAIAVLVGIGIAYYIAHHK
jgi:hypothetical protein